MRHLHEGVDRPWARTGVQLARQPARSRPGLWLGLIHDDRGNRMTPSHAVKKAARYRYYVSCVLAQGRKELAGSVSRVAAHDVETIVRDALAALSQPSSFEPLTEREPIKVLHRARDRSPGHDRDPAHTAGRTARPGWSDRSRLVGQKPAPEAAGDRAYEQLWPSSADPGRSAIAAAARHRRGTRLARRDHGGPDARHRSDRPARAISLRSARMTLSLAFFGSRHHDSISSRPSNRKHWIDRGCEIMVAATSGSRCE